MKNLALQKGFAVVLVLVLFGTSETLRTGAWR